MSNLPFDFGMDKADTTGARPDEPLSVTALSRCIEAALAAGLPGSVRVQGEVANVTLRNGHRYFSMRDGEASISCVMWASDAARCPMSMVDGDRVVAGGSVVHWAPGGRTQLRVRSLEPAGEGLLLATFKARCDELRERGWFDPEQRRALPRSPRRIAVLTSKTGAAVHDFVATARNRFPSCRLLLVDIPVQGAAAAARIAIAVRRVDQAAKALGIDAIVLTRGGGSLEDLWAFNELEPATAVHACRTPVVAAIGHESDVTLVELVADARAATPTAAATLLLPDRDECRARLGLVDRAMQRAAMSMVQSGHHAAAACSAALHGLAQSNVHRLRAPVLNLERRLHATRPDVVLHRQRQLLDLLRVRLRTAVGVRHRLGTDRLGRLPVAALMARTLERARVRVSTLHRALEAIDPDAVLGRGYSLTLNAQGEVIRSAAQVAHGEVLLTRTGKGQIHSRVEPDPAVS